MEEQTLVYTYYEVLFNLKKKGNSDVSYNLYELEDIIPSEIIKEFLQNCALKNSVFF